MTANEVRAAIHHGGKYGKPPADPPAVMVKWWGEGLAEQYGSELQRFDSFREDVDVVPFPLIGFTPRDDGFYWHVPQNTQSGKVGIDSSGALPDWDALPGLLAELPNPEIPGLFDYQKRCTERAHAEGRYVLLHHWHLMYERIWQFRGMQNLLTDYYEYPDEVHALHRAVCDAEKRLLERAAEEVGADGYMFSDDLGDQRSLMMSPDTFREFIKPYYIEIFDTAHRGGMDVWMHTCGNVTEIVGDLIECGLDVLHPIQKHTMDWDKIAAEWKGKIAFWVGMDVQDTLINGTPDQIRAEIKLIRDTFGSEEGGLLIAAGNGIVRGTPIENIEAFLGTLRS